MKKTKLFVLATIVFISISPFAMSIPNTNKSYELPALSFVGIGDVSMDSYDQISFQVSSGGAINVYIMTDMQFETLKNSGGLTWEYLIRFKDITYVSYKYTVESSDDYYVVFYNKGLISVFIEYDISWIPYNPYNPDNPSDIPYNPFFGPFLFIFLIVIIISAIGIPLSVYFHRKKKRNLSKKEQEIKNELYYSSRGAIITDGSKFCQNCGTVITEGSKFCKNCGKLLK